MYARLRSRLGRETFGDRVDVRLEHLVVRLCLGAVGAYGCYACHERYEEKRKMSDA